MYANIQCGKNFANPPTVPINIMMLLWFFNYSVQTYAGPFYLLLVIIRINRQMTDVR